MMNMVEENLHDERPSKDPEFEIKVLQKLEEITQLSDQAIQTILRVVDTKDLALAMINTSEALQERIYANMSARVGTLIREYIQSIESIEEDRVAKGQAGLVHIVQDLIEQGKISWPPQDPSERKPSTEYFDQKKAVIEKLNTKPIVDMDFNELTKAVVDMAEIARMEGILQLEDLGWSMGEKPGQMDAFYNMGVRLIVDGTAPHLVEELMEAKKKVLLHHYETQLDMIITGIQSIQFGNSPRIIDQKLKVMY